MLQYPFNTARELKKEVIGLSDISARTIQKMSKKVGPAVSLRRKEAVADHEDGKKRVRVLQKVQVVD